jgi:hypothetical protein
MIAALDSEELIIKLTWAEACQILVINLEEDELKALQFVKGLVGRVAIRCKSPQEQSEPDWCGQKISPQG